MDHLLRRRIIHNYYQEHCPVDELEQFLTPLNPNPGDPSEMLLELVAPSLPFTHRELAFGGPWNRAGCPNASALRAKLVDCCTADDRTARFDIGPVYEQPYAVYEMLRLARAPKTSRQVIALSEFRVDIDATDLSHVRQACGCGQSRTAMCPRCALAVSAIAQYTDAVMRGFGAQHVLWVGSGGRGIHGHCVDYSWMRKSTTDREEIVKLLSSDDLLCEVGEVLRHTESVLGLSTPLSPVIDKKVSTDYWHLIRAPCSIHEATLKVSTPLSSAAAFTDQVCPEAEAINHEIAGQAWQNGLQAFRDFLYTL